MAKRERNVLRFNIQRKIVANMTTVSWRHIPHVSFIYDADVTDFLAAYNKFNEETPYYITFNTVMLKALSEGIKAAPRINAHMHFEPRLVRGKLTFFDNIDISVPWTLPDGNMMTITMKDMGNKTLKEMSEYTVDINRRLKNTNLTEALYSVSINDTIETLKSGHIMKALLRLYGSKTNPRHKVTPLKGHEKEAYESIPETDRITIDDLKQGTITISNIGAAAKGINGALDMLMIIPPQICAIGISSMQRRPTVVTDEDGNEKIEIRTILPMCICFDHRALDFGEVSPFIRKMEEIFKNPWSVMN
ncbi:MAG: 2-oxo acid dehydrogenase subunit E2 [Clostridia bacterium]|nr:2-oxo acid dehydrogenase subunit E2 [Clostridia bacterium]